MQRDLFDDDAKEPADGLPPCGIALPSARPPGFWIGTCAWQYDDWQDWFYPPGLPKERSLAYYARFHNAVEVDSSFYRVPSTASVDRWRTETPERFRFALKAPRSLTHGRTLSLDDITARRDWEALLSVAGRLGAKLGVVLLQLGPGSAIADFARLRHVGETVPAGMRVAVEFRHRTWQSPEVNAWLRERGFARAWTDHYLNPARQAREDDREANATTAPFAFVRLMGDASVKYDPATGERRFRYGKILFDRRADLEGWVARLKARPRHEETFVFASNHYEGFAPLTCEKIRQALGS